MTDDGLSDLRSTWSKVAAAPESGVVAASVDRAKRTRLLLQVVRATVALAAVAGLAVAVAHAAEPREAMLALVLGVAIIVSWIATSLSERRQRDLLPAPAGEYVDARLQLLRSQRRLLGFIWLVLALDLVFLVPWLASGLGLHIGPQPSISVIVLLWLPLVILAAFAIWTIRRLRIITSELTLLETARRPNGAQR